MADHSPPRHLILSLLGLYARDGANWLSVRSLIELMTDLDVDASATRSSVSRLKKRGVLEPAKTNGQAGYRLSSSALAVLREGDARIWSRPRASVGDGWLIVVFSVPEAERGKRHELRSLLTRLGFGTAAPGVWIAPGTACDETLAALDRAELTSYTELFRGAYLGSGPADVRVGEWWDLPAIAALYDEFVAEAQLPDPTELPGPGPGVHGVRPDADRLAASALPRPRHPARAAAGRLARSPRRRTVRPARRAPP